MGSLVAAVTRLGMSLSSGRLGQVLSETLSVTASLALIEGFMHSQRTVVLEPAWPLTSSTMCACCKLLRADPGHSS